MQYLLSLPENLVKSFYNITGHAEEDWFVASDPQGARVGSGGGTAFLLSACQQHSQGATFSEFLELDKKIIIHAGGQSRRLPAYAPSGKILSPIPVFRWSRGQSLNQSLLDLQLPLFENVMKLSSPKQNTMVASGDVMILADELPAELPDVDVLCLGIWADPELASRHGVFFTPRHNPSQLDFMLQKPSHQQIEDLSSSYLFMMDIGIWLLSDRAVEVLMSKCGWDGTGFKNGVPDFYDMYSSFGTCLGGQPSVADEEISKLSVAIVSLDNSEFYHYGTSRELISSTEHIQNRVQDQRHIWHNRIKPHPSLFVQNSLTEIQLNKTHSHIWIENSHLGSDWHLVKDHVITGVPSNTWSLTLRAGICLDFIPVGDDQYCIRPYGMDDAFRGKLSEESTLWMGQGIKNWFIDREIGLDFFETMLRLDIQSAPLFPLLPKDSITGEFVQWMMDGEPNKENSRLWLDAERLSADDISIKANLMRLQAQRDTFRRSSLNAIASNYKRSVFYQIDLKQVADDYHKGQLSLPKVLPDSESSSLRYRDYMFRSEFKRANKEEYGADEDMAFKVLRETLLDSVGHKATPQLNVFSDQIIWGRSPARIDLAGGWSDTPPFCMQEGGSVMNLAVELNGQPPIQVYIRLSTEKKITLRSIDNGVSEVVHTFDELKALSHIGSSFSIPKAALCLAGFHPDYCGVKYATLERQLADFGGGFEISMLAAIPKGSGLGTSSILAATLLGTLSDFCQLNWDKQKICHRTLLLEQLLTTGGGWQDQYGGILPGVKLLESNPGSQELMGVRWLPDHVFTKAEYKDNWLLYYTGITRVAKDILKEIVRGMFLNEGQRLATLQNIKHHAYHTAEAIQRCDYEAVARMVAKSWDMNNLLDSGTMTREVEIIVNRIKDYTIGLKLLGAGGGGYMLICAKDPYAAGRIKNILTNNAPNKSARFVKMDISQDGFLVSRS